MLAYTLGVRQLIVAINKMDSESVQFSEKRFTEIRTEISAILKKIGFSLEKVAFVPISGWTGENLTEGRSNFSGGNSNFVLINQPPPTWDGTLVQPWLTLLTCWKLLHDQMTSLFEFRFKMYSKFLVNNQHLWQKMMFLTCLFWRCRNNRHWSCR